MKKYKMMALTGILLSSTILGASTSVIPVSAASDNALDVDTSAVTNKVINVINDLLNSSSTANTVNSQTQFSDLVDGQTKDATPIFGKKTPSEFVKTLKGEMNVVDSNNQLVPMSIVTTDSVTGFITQVSYTLDGVTKTISINYTYDQPTVSFDDNQTMNFRSDDDAAKVTSTATNLNTVIANTTNGADANGHENKVSVTASKSENTVTFTPSDNYVKNGKITAKRTINLYAEPDWTNLNNTDSGNSRTVQNSDDISKQAVITNSKGQLYSVELDSKPVISDDEKSATVNYIATAIDSKGNTIKDAITGDPIIYDKNDQTINIDSANIYPTITFKDIRSGNVIFTKTLGATKSGDTIDSATISKYLPSGYNLSNPADFNVTDANKTASYLVYKDAKTTYNFVDLVSGKTVGTADRDGHNGAPVTLSAPENYKLVDESDIVQRLDADQQTKNIYVKPVDNVSALNYTVTFRDKTTGKTVGTDVNGTGNFGTYVGLTAPSGYAFASVLDNGFILLKNNQQVTKYVTAADTPYDVSFVDQDTGKTVGTQAGKGADGSTIVLKAPTDYAFVSADDVNYTIDKDTPTSTVYVTKSDQTVDNIVAGYPKNGYIKIYDGNGKLNNDVVLSEGSDWIIDKTVTINGSEYYRVATNEYVKASDVYKYVPLQTIFVTNGNNVTPVYNSKGQLLLDRALDTSTPWYTDRSATIRGNKMYRVATDEWVKASDGTLR